MSTVFTKSSQPQSRQASMMTWHPLQILQIAAVDVLNVLTSDGSADGKVLDMGDLFARFLWASSIPNETSTKRTRTNVDEWILRLGPPDRLLSDR